MVIQHFRTLVLAIQNGITPCYQQRGNLTIFWSLAVCSQRILRLVFLFIQRILSSPVTCSLFVFSNRHDLCTGQCDRGRAAQPQHQAASRWGPFSCSSVGRKTRSLCSCFLSSATGVTCVAHFYLILLLPSCYDLDGPPMQLILVLLV